MPQRMARDSRVLKPAMREVVRLACMVFKEVLVGAPNKITDKQSWSRL